MRSRVLLAVVCALLVFDSSGSAAAAEGIETEHRTSPVAPGLSLTRFERFGPRGWLRGEVLTADLSQPGLRPRYLRSGAVSERKPLTELASRQGAVAGVNGDFFDINGSGAPLGVGVDRGEARNAPARGHNRTVVVNDSARLVQAFVSAAVLRADGSRIKVGDLNVPKVTSNGIALYTPAWGGASRRGAVAPGQPVAEVEVVDGVVRRVSDAPAEGPAAPNAVRLLGTGAGAGELRALRPGERVDVRFAPKPAARAAISGDHVVLRRGAVQPVPSPDGPAPRTGIGFSADGKRMWLMTVDGGPSGTWGTTRRGLGVLMKSFGADTALNLDGGGSSTLVARQPGDPAALVQNRLSHGRQRPVPNGFGFTVAPGSGRLTGFRIEPPDERVFSGLSRRLRAFGHDEVGAPVPGRPQWTVQGSGRVEGSVFRAGAPGLSTVSTQPAGRASLHVLGPLAQLDGAPVRLPGPATTGPLRVSGQDGEGFRTWVEPSDVRLSYDPRLLRVRPDGDHFEVTALSPQPAVVTEQVGDRVRRVPVSVGAASPAVPPDPPPQDPSVVLDGSLPARPGAERVAVVGGINADRRPGSRNRARRALRDARRARPDMVVVDGDFVAHGDIALARKLVHSELDGRVRWCYAPGRGEVKGRARPFRAAFGRTHRVVDSRGTRFVLLDMSRGTLRAGGFDQVRMLRSSLWEAGSDPSVRSVAVVAAGKSADPEESALLDRWLARFRETSGKPLVAIDGQGPFGDGKVEGVQHVTSGNGAGLTGTSLLRIGPRGIRWQTRPFVDRLRLDVPPVRAGETARVGASFEQGRRDVPVAYPVSADWSGSRVHVGDPAGAGPGQVAAFDPRTGRLVGLRPGSGVLRVVVNGVARRDRVVVQP